MAANQTIINAAKAAYTRPKVDVSAQVKAMAAVSQMVVKLGEDAKKKMDELNKEFNLMDFMDKPELEAMMTEIRNDKSLSQEEKITKFKGYKNSMNKLEEWSLTVGEMFKNEEISGGMDSETQTWLSTLISGKFYGPNSLQDKNNDGVISDDERDALSPIRMNPGNKKMEVLGVDGKYISVDKLPGSFIKKTDGKSLGDGIRKISSGVTKGALKDPYIEENLVKINDAILNDSKGTKSAKYDQRFNMKYEPGGQTFVEYYLENYLNDVSEYEGDDDLIKLINDYDDALYGSKAKKVFANNIFRSITENEDTNDEFLQFIKLSMEYSLRDAL